MRIIGIVGSRKRDAKCDYELTEKKFLDIYQEGDTIVSGGCPQGGDRFAEIIAKKYGLTITIHYPDWKKYGRGAGFVRNTKIAYANKLIACVAADRKGGTEDTIKKFIDRLNLLYSPVIDDYLFLV